MGWVVAAFFVLVFPGNISRFAKDIDAFGLNSDLSRGLRLLFQPVPEIWALSTGACMNGAGATQLKSPG